MAKYRWMDALIAGSRCLHGLWSPHSIKPMCPFGIKIHCPLSRGCTGRDFSMFIFCPPLQCISPHKSPVVTKTMDDGNAFSWPLQFLVTLIIMTLSLSLLALSLLQSFKDYSEWIEIQNGLLFAYSFWNHIMFWHHKICTRNPYSYTTLLLESNSWYPRGKYKKVLFLIKVT